MRFSKLVYWPGVSLSHSPRWLSGLSWCLACLLLCTACDRHRQEPAGNGERDGVILLDELRPLPPPATLAEKPGLKVAVAAILSPQGTIASYQRLMALLERLTGAPVTLVQRKTYQETNDLLARGVVDVGFVCTGAYLEGARQGSMSLLVVPQINGNTTYRSFFVVPAASPATHLADLRGKIFAFTDPLSNSGYLYPLSQLQVMGEQPEGFFSRTIFTYSHDRSIAAVLEGVADGAAVDSLVYDFAVLRDPGIAEQTRVIQRSPEFGIPPVVVPSSTAGERHEWLRRLFLGLHRDEEGRQALEALGVERFVDADPARYVQ